MNAEAGVVDTLVNCFLSNRQEVWDGAIAASGISVKVRRDPTDAFCEPDEMVARMDELGIATLCLSTCEVGDHGKLSPYEFDHVATRWEEMEKLVDRFPGRFVALAVPFPNSGMKGVRELRAKLAEPWVAGFYLHTHSWDRRFDHADYYPYYALCSEFDVPFAMQAGTSGGLYPSECGQPIGIDRPALYFPQTKFVLSHQGWRAVAEGDPVIWEALERKLFIGSYVSQPQLIAVIGHPGGRRDLDAHLGMWCR